MGFLPFVNDHGRRLIRWRRLFCMWAAVIAASTVGAGVVSWALTGAFWDYATSGVALGVLFASFATVSGLQMPVDSLPTV